MACPERTKRRLLLPLAAAFFCLLFSGLAQAGTKVNVDSAGLPYVPPFQFWTDRASEQVPTPEAEVDLKMSGCPGISNAAACTVPAGFWDMPRPTVWIKDDYLHPAEPEMTRYIFFHELGHVFDYVHLQDTDRTNIIKMLGFPSDMGWYGGPSGRPNEMFAEGASQCWFGDETPGSAYNYPFNYRETQPLCRAIEAIRAGDTDWYGETIIPARQRLVKINRSKVRHGYRVRWGGNAVTIYLGGGRQKTFYRCSGLAPFRDGYVRFNLCGKRIRSTNTIGKPFYLHYWSIPARRS